MALLLVVATLFVQDISWQPTTPRQGSLIVVSAPDAIAGEMAGEPLHFRNDRALAAVPLSATDSITLQTLSIRWDGAVVGATASVPVELRSAEEEQVQAAERFTPPPDSALQVRIDRERELLRDAASRAHAAPRLWKAPFIRPRTARITSPFGSGRQVNGVWRTRHLGLDLAGQKGAVVRASNREHGRRVPGVTAGVLDRFVRYDWPGNVSELKNVIDGMVTTTRGRLPLDVANLPDALRSGDEPGARLEMSVGMTLAAAERRLVEATLAHTGGDKRRAAAMLGIGLRTLYRRLDEWGLR